MADIQRRTGPARLDREGAVREHATHPANHGLGAGDRLRQLVWTAQLLLERGGRLAETRYVGEVGLDGGPRFYKTMEAQRRVFRRILECCAEAGDKVLTVHSTHVVKPVLDLIETCLLPERGRVVLHWFGGSRSEARRGASRRALALGCFFSVNATMLATDRGKALVASLPSDRLLTETDGPFTPGRDGPAHPKDVELAVEAIAGLRGSAADEVRNGLIRTLRDLLAIG